MRWKVKGLVCKSSTKQVSLFHTSRLPPNYAWNHACKNLQSKTGGRVARSNGSYAAPAYSAYGTNFLWELCIDLATQVWQLPKLLKPPGIFLEQPSHVEFLDLFVVRSQRSPLLRGLQRCSHPRIVCLGRLNSEWLALGKSLAALALVLQLQWSGSRRWRHWF